MVQYVVRYQYPNTQPTIQTYGAVEVRSIIRFYTAQNRSATKIYKKLCVVYSELMPCGPCTTHNFLCTSITLYFGKYVSNFHSIVHLNCVYWYLSTYCTIRLEIFTVYSTTKLGSTINLVSFRSFVAAYEFRETYF